MRIVSLIPSSTEIVYALGQGDHLVGRSHECDFPAEVHALPSLTEAKLKIELDPESGHEPTSAEIDAQVKALLREALAVYRVDADALRALEPDVIITQTQCDVCAVSLRDVEAAVCTLISTRPRIVALQPNSLEDVFGDLQAVADALGVPDAGHRLQDKLRGRIAALATRAQALLDGGPAPTVATIEWIEPLMAGGNWMPTLVELAGGRNLFGEAGRHSPWLSFEELAAADPDVIVVVPCGFGIPRTRREMRALMSRPGWSKLAAVRAGRVYLADGNQYFNRPGPRVVESLEILVEILHGEPLGALPSHRGTGFVAAPIPAAPASDNVPVAGLSTRPRSKGQGDAMAQESIRVSAVLPASAGEIYEAWLDGKQHGQLTGGAATVEARIGGRHTAWDGYIEGTILELAPGQRIVQSWRSLDFPQDAPDSRLEIILSSAPGGTEVTLVHTEIPEGQGADYEEGWKEHYFKPMQRFFSPVAAPAPAPPRAAAPAKKAVKAAPAPVKKAAKAAKAAPVKKAAKAAPAKKKAKPVAKKAAPKKKGKPAKKAKPTAKKAAPKKAKAKAKKKAASKK